MLFKLGIAVVAALSSARLGKGAEQETFVRPNVNECGAQTNFLAYAATLGDVVQCQGPECDYQEQSGLFFDLKYRKNYKVVKYNQLDVDVTYVLYQCGTEKPDDQFIKGLNQSTTAFVEIPVTAVATGDSTAAWMLEELQVEDRVRYAASTATAPCMLKIALPQKDGGCNRPFFDSNFAQVPNVTDYDVEFAFGQADSTAAKQVAFRVSLDPGPLRRAEHIVYMSAFFNLEARAIAYYKDLEMKYDELSALPGDNAPVMAWMSRQVASSFNVDQDGNPFPEGSILYTVSLAPYKVAYTTDAGAQSPEQVDIAKEPAFESGTDVTFAASKYPNLKAAQTAVKDMLKGVDILIDESFTGPDDKNLTNFLKEWGITAAEKADFPFLANDNLWAHDKDRAETGNDDWFGEGIARPDLVLTDLRAIVAPGQFADHTSIFFRNIALNEKATSFGTEACMAVECTSYANQEALIVGEAAAPGPAPMPAAVPDTAEPMEAPAPAPMPAMEEGEEGAAVPETEEGDDTSDRSTGDGAEPAVGSAVEETAGAVSWSVAGAAVAATAAAVALF